MKKIKFFLLIYFIFFQPIAKADDNFDKWLISFKKKAESEGISIETINKVMDKAIFLPKVIEYDRFQPEFYEDTKTYINKRVTKSKIKKGLTLYNEQKLIINDIENKFSVEKELLLSLMGIETNFGKYLGKMDIVSSLATLYLLFNLDSLPWVGFAVAFLWSIYNLLRKKIDVDTDIGLFIESLFILPIALVIFYLIFKNNLNDFSLANPSLLGLIFLAGPMTVIPLFLYIKGVQLSGLGPSGMIFFITPTGQFLLGFFYYNETFSTEKFISFIIIWIAVFIYLKDLYENH